MIWILYYCKMFLGCAVQLLQTLPYCPTKPREQRLEIPREDRQRLLYHDRSMTLCITRISPLQAKSWPWRMDLFFSFPFLLLLHSSLTQLAPVSHIYDSPNRSWLTHLPVAMTQTQNRGLDGEKCVDSLTVVTYALSLRFVLKHVCWQMYAQMASGPFNTAVNSTLQFFHLDSNASR